MNEPIVIIGGGFGGVYTAKALLKKSYPVLLISETNYFTFTPLLHEVATGSLLSHDVIFEYETFFHHPAFEFVRGRVERIDRAQKRVWVDGEEMSYRYLVVATGSTTNFFKMQGTEHAYVLKDVEDAIKLKNAILSKAQDKDHHISVSVVGGGPTGVEIMFEVAEMLTSLRKKDPDLSFQLHLVHANEVLWGVVQASVQTYIHKAMEAVQITPVCSAFCERITPNQIVTTVGTFPSDVTIVASGVKPNTSVFARDIILDEQGHVPVTPELQVVEDQHMFALGDIIAIDGEPVPKLAQTATREAVVVAENIHRMETKRSLRTYKPEVVGMLFSLGFGKGVGVINGITIKGVLAWWLWRTVYLFKTPGVVNKLRVAFSWTLGLFQSRNLTEL